MAWWRHKMETFSALLAICAGNSPVPGEFPPQRPVTRSFDVYFDLRPDKRLSKQSLVNSPQKGRWRGAFTISLICTWTNGWVSNREAGDLSCHRAPYDVIVMIHQNLFVVFRCFIKNELTYLRYIISFILKLVDTHVKYFHFIADACQLTILGPTILSAILVFYSHWLTLFPPWINDHIPCKFGWNYLSIP